MFTVDVKQQHNNNNCLMLSSVFTDKLFYLFQRKADIDGIKFSKQLL